MFKHLKITKRSLKSPGTVEEVLRHCGAVAARLLHTPPRAAKSGQQRRSIMASSLLPFFTGGEHHRYLQNNQKRSKQVCCSFSFFVFSPASLPSNLPNLEPGVARAANRPGVWMAGSATFLLPFHFCNGGVVHRCHGCEIGAHPSFGFLPLLHCSSASLLISSSSL